MMQLSEKAIEDFKKIYLEEHNISLSDADANRLGLELLEYVKLIFKPIPEDSINYSFLYGIESTGLSVFMPKKSCDSLTLNQGFYSLWEI
jgi:hypothetical protein